MYSIRRSQLSGHVIAPPSKSHSLRAILFASMAHGKSTLSNVLPSPDVAAMINACKKLGAFIQRKHNALEINGVSGKPQLPDDVIDVGNSGLLLRFIASIVCVARTACRVNRRLFYSL